MDLRILTAIVAMAGLLTGCASDGGIQMPGGHNAKLSAALAQSTVPETLIAAGDVRHQKIKSAKSFSTSNDVRRVRRATNKLLPHAFKSGAELEVHVVKDVDIYAFSDGAKHIYVSEGLIADTSGNEAELELIVAQQIAHIDALHVERGSSCSLGDPGRITPIPMPNCRSLVTEGDTLGARIMFLANAGDQSGERIRNARKYIDTGLAFYQRKLEREEAIREEGERRAAPLQVMLDSKCKLHNEYQNILLKNTKHRDVSKANVEKEKEKCEEARETYGPQIAVVMSQYNPHPDQSMPVTKARITNIERAADYVCCGDKADNNSFWTDVTEKTLNTVDKLVQSIAREERLACRDVDALMVQSSLNDLGYQCGVADGQIGPRTLDCIAEYQQAEGLQKTRKIDAALCSSIKARAEA